MAGETEFERSADHDDVRRVRRCVPKLSLHARPGVGNAPRSDDHRAFGGVRENARLRLKDCGLEQHTPTRADSRGGD